MARILRTQWRQKAGAFTPGSLCEIARSGSSHRSEPEPGAGATPQANAGEVVRRRIWRAMTWIMFANVLAFWLLTCITAFSTP
jgi:hypothetical protein